MVAEKPASREGAHCRGHGPRVPARPRPRRCDLGHFLPLSGPVSTSNSDEKLPLRKPGDEGSPSCGLLPQDMAAQAPQKPQDRAACPWPPVLVTLKLADPRS